MRISREQVKNLKDGTVLTIFLSGSDWDGDFGKAVKVIKFKDSLMKYELYCDIDEIDTGDSFDIQAAIKGIMGEYD